jgi:hypothetical protein
MSYKKVMNLVSDICNNESGDLRAAGQKIVLCGWLPFPIERDGA